MHIPFITSLSHGLGRIFVLLLLSRLRIPTKDDVAKNAGSGNFVLFRVVTEFLLRQKFVIYRQKESLKTYVTRTQQRDVLIFQRVAVE